MVQRQVKLFDNWKSDFSVLPIFQNTFKIHLFKTLHPFWFLNKNHITEILLALTKTKRRYIFGMKWQNFKFFTKEKGWQIQSFLTVSLRS